MLDRRFIVENVELVQRNCRQPRERRPTSLASSRSKSQRKAKQLELDDLNRQANEVSKSIGKAKDPAEREARKAEGRRLREQAPPSEPSLNELAAEADAILRAIPNLTHPAAPIGGRRQGEPAKSAAARRRCRSSLSSRSTTCSLAEKLDLMDFEAGAKVAGHGFYFLKNEAVLLELALQRYALDLLMRRRLHADDHARPGPQRNPARHRLHRRAARRRKSTASPTAT